VPSSLSCRSTNIILASLRAPSPAPGTIDSDYRGEVKVLFVNLGQEAVRAAPTVPLRGKGPSPPLRLGFCGAVAAF
jgi:hypothetical protein